jgi:hypothetical protein
MRAVEECIDVSEVRPKELVQPDVNPLHIRGSVEAPLDPGLVGDTNDQETVLTGKCQPETDPPIQFESLGLLEIMKIGIEGSVAVDEEGRPRSMRWDRGRRRHTLEDRRRP